jgi:uncharacterized protein YhdP
MNLPVTRAQPAAVPAGAAARTPRAWLQLAAWTLGGVTLLGLAVLIVAELAVAQLPQQRAALEELIRSQTGLEVTFRELTLRWGWYGPEALFSDVALGEPGGQGARLRAPQLIVGLDIWRLMRSGELEASRITLRDADIDLGAPVTTRKASPAQAPRAALPSGGARLLSRWRGSRIELEGGTLRWPQPGLALPLTLSIRHAQLRRQDSTWNADAAVLLPASLGASAHLSLQMRGDPARPAGTAGTLSFEGRRLEFAGWRALGELPALARYMPQAGRGDLELRTEFARGRLLRADGALHAQELEWTAGSAPSALRLQRLQASWQLAREGTRWRLELRSQEPGLERAAPLTLSADVAEDGSRARGRLQDAPLALVAAALRSALPQLPLAQVGLVGEVRELSFDWDSHRDVGARLRSRAVLEELGIASAAHDVVLTGLSAQVAAGDQELRADLEAQDAQLAVSREDEPFALDGLRVSAHLALAPAGAGWQLRSDALELRQGELSVAASGTLLMGAAQPELRAHAQLRDADVQLLADLLGPRVLASLGAAAQLSAGHIARAQLEWRGPWDNTRPPWAAGAEFSGTLELHDARVRGADPWPEAHSLEARIEWHGPSLHATLADGRIGAFRVTSASADWDARGAHPARLGARLAGRAEEALAWLREQPQLAAAVPGLESLELRGDTLIDIDTRLPAAGARRAASRTRVTALLEGVQLRAIAGVPPIGSLSGTLAFAAGQLQASTLTGTWLGRPVTLGVGEWRDAGPGALTIWGRGQIDAQQAARAAGAPGEAPLEGAADWSAQLTLLPGVAGGAARWRLHADSSLIGIASALPEPFAKLPAAALPLHIEVQAGGAAGQLRIALGERLRALASLARSGELWRIERGTVRLAPSAPALPAEAVLSLEGRVGRLDLPAALALWRAASEDAALPGLRAQLTAAQLMAGSRSYPEVSVRAFGSQAGGELELESATLSGSARWDAQLTPSHPAVVQLASLELGEWSDAALGAQLAAALAPAVQLTVSDLRWQGRGLGEFSATLHFAGGAFSADDWRLAADSGQARGSARCAAEDCRLSFSLESRDAAATLAAFGFRPEIESGAALLQGELEWPRQGQSSLAGLAGSLHMQLGPGSTRATQAGGERFALLAVPALTAAIGADPAAEPSLGFTRVTGDFVLRGGQAMTSNLHFDGDAEILVRGRTGLVARDYDEQAWILRGEERLPAALRGFAPTPKVAALWLSLRELFAGSAAPRARAALHLHGSWDEPIVSAVE